MELPPCISPRLGRKIAAENRPFICATDAAAIQTSATTARSFCSVTATWKPSRASRPRAIPQSSGGGLLTRNQVSRQKEMITTLPLSSVPHIELGGRRTSTTLFAEAELRRYLELIFDKAAQHEPMRLKLGVDAQSGLSDEGYAWEFDGGEIRIVAGGDLGLVFGVYAFLRDVCGCRFCGLGTEGEHVPRVRELPATI